MKATGIVRRIDDLGRVVIPKEIRRNLRIREGEPLEIFVDTGGEVLLKKYSAIGKHGDFAKQYADSLFEVIGHIVCIADRDIIIAVSGAAKEEFLNKPISSIVEKAIEDHKLLLIADPGEKACPIADEREANNFTSEVIAPIISEGDPIGAVIICSKEPGVKMADMEVKLAQTAATFLAKQME